MNKLLMLEWSTFIDVLIMCSYSIVFLYTYDVYHKTNKQRMANTMKKKEDL
jgi:hypothetical protein